MPGLDRAPYRGGMTRFACVALVDRQGRLLLQERDEHAPVSPELWSLPGGHMEPGEQPLPAAVREIREETELAIDPGALRLVGEFSVHPELGDARAWVYAAAVDLTDDDIVCHEGRRIVFVEPAVIADLPVTDTLEVAMPHLLGPQVWEPLLAGPVARVVTRAGTVAGDADPAGPSL